MVMVMMMAMMMDAMMVIVLNVILIITRCRTDDPSPKQIERAQNMNAVQNCENAVTMHCR